MITETVEITIKVTRYRTDCGMQTCLACQWLNENCYTCDNLGIEISDWTDEVDGYPLPLPGCPVWPC